MISSLSNPAVKRIRALRRRREREESGLFFAEGIRIVAEAAELGAEVETLVVAPDLLTSEFAREVVQRLVRRGVPALEVTASVFQALSAKEGPQGIGAVVRQRWQRLSDAALEGQLCWIALEAVADPGNLGTIVRTSDAVGGAGIILVGPSTDPYDPASIRASMGAIFSQGLIRTGFDELAAWKREHGVLLVGTADAAATEYRAVTYRQPLVLFMGSERQGLSEEAMAVCDIMIRIPMVGHADSLNLAVATGVVLYEIFDQLRK